MKLRISVADIEVEAELNDSETSNLIYTKLPIEGIVNTWGDEIYFEIPVVADLSKNSRSDMELGEIAYWPVGKAFCIFFGRTPASVNDNPKAASDVNPLGKILGNSKVFQNVNNGAKIKLERI